MTIIDKVGGRKFFLAVCSLLVIVLNGPLNLGLDTATLASLAAVAVGYFVGNGLAAS